MAVTVRMLSGQIVEVQCQYLSAPWYASTSGVDWCGACQPGDTQSAALLGFDIAVADIYRESSILNYSHHQPRFSMLSRLVRSGSTGYSP